MGVEKRKCKRFSDYAKVTAADICVFNGVLCDISSQGCLVRFPLGAEADNDSDYEITIVPSRKQKLASFKLIVRPMRIFGSTDSYEVGFKIMRSPGTPQLQEYLKFLTNSENDSYDTMVSECLFA